MDYQVPASTKNFLCTSYANKARSRGFGDQQTQIVFLTKCKSLSKAYTIVKCPIDFIATHGMVRHDPHHIKIYMCSPDDCVVFSIFNEIMREN